MGCASSKGAAAVPATGNGNAPNDPAGGPMIVVTDTLKPPDVILEEGELPPKPSEEDEEAVETTIVEVEPEKPAEEADSAVEDDTDEVVREIQLAVPEVENADGENPEESPAEPEVVNDNPEESEESPEAKEEVEEGKTEPMDTNEESLFGDMAEDEANKVLQDNIIRETNEE